MAQPQGLPQARLYAWAAELGKRRAAAEGVGQGLQGNHMVPGAGLEPAHAFAHRLLRTACLPIPPPRHCSLTKRKARVPTQARAQIKSLEVRLYLILKQRGARPVKVRLCAPPGGGGTFRRDSVAIQVGGGPGSDLWHPKGGRQTYLIQLQYHGTRILACSNYLDGKSRKKVLLFRLFLYSPIPRPRGLP